MVQLSESDILLLGFWSCRSPVWDLTLTGLDDSTQVQN